MCVRVCVYACERNNVSTVFVVALYTMYNVLLPVDTSKIYLHITKTFNNNFYNKLLPNIMS